MCHYVSALFKTAATLKGKKKLPSFLCSLWLKLTSVERARIPSLVSIYHPGDSQEHTSEKPGNRNHTEDYLDHISPGFLFPSCFLGHTGRLQRPFRRVISYVKLASWVDSCTSDSPPTSLTQVWPHTPDWESSLGPPMARLFRAPNLSSSVGSSPVFDRWCGGGGLSIDWGSNRISSSIRITVILILIITIAFTKYLLCA